MKKWLRWGAIAKPRVGKNGRTVLMPADDPRNPLHVFRMPITAAVRDAARDIGGTDVVTAHHMLVRFMDSFKDFRFGIPSGPSPETVLREKLGICGHFTNTLVALAATRGIAGRLVNLHNSPPGDGHTVAEFFFDGRWHLYDPTYAAYYSAEESDSDGERVLSFEEIRARYRSGKPVFATVGSPRPGSDIFTASRTFLDADPAGVIGPDRPMMFPLSLNIRARAGIDEKDFGPSFQGANYLGAASRNQMQAWSLEGLDASRQHEFAVIPKSIGGEVTDSPEFRLSTALSGGKLTGPASRVFVRDRNRIMPPSEWRIGFIAEASVATLRLEHPYRGPAFWYLRVSKYELIAKD